MYDVYDLHDAPTKTMKGYHDLQIVCYIKKEEKVDRYQFINMEVVKPISRNTAKYLKMRQEIL